MIDIITIRKVKAQSNTNSYPTIPFVPPNVSTTPTPTQTPSSGPTIYFETIKNDYAVNETGEIRIKIDTKGQTVDQFNIVITYDATHLEVIDSNTDQDAIQIDYEDTFFIPFTNEVEVENGVGTITISAQATNNVAQTITSRTIGIINFRIISQKASNLEISDDLSTLVLSNANLLDTSSLIPLTINSTGVTISVTPTGTPSTIPTEIPDTALSNPTSVIFFILGVTLIASGVMLQRSVRKLKKNEASGF